LNVADALPPGLEHVRTTAVFDAQTVPPGLLRAHRIAAGVWGRLTVDEGSLRFVFEDNPGGAVRVAAGESMIIPPSTPHHVEPDADVRFAVEFHSSPTGGS
jgi:tellurite resistance-related uncharacterized protein